MSMFDAIRDAPEWMVLDLQLQDRSLLEQTEGEGGDTPLIAAVEHGELDMVKRLVEEGADVNGAGTLGETALIRANKNGHEHMVSFLLRKGAKAGVADDMGNTPLIWACMKGYLRCIERLIRALPREALQRCLEHKGQNRKTALQVAAFEKHTEVVVYLVNKALQASFGKAGWTPLMWACYEGHLEVAQVLYEGRGQNLEAQNGDGRTALYYAVHRGHKDVVAYLLSKGAQHSTKYTVHDRGDSRKGQTLLMMASKEGHVEVVKLLLNHTNGQGLEERDDYGRTALFCAAQGGHKDVVAFLLSRGAQANHTNNTGLKPLMEASWQGHLGVVQMLIGATKGQGVEEKDEEGRTALFYAAREGHRDVVTLLLKHGAQANHKDNGGFTPLMGASEKGHLEVVQVLLEATKGQGLEERDAYGRTALFYAVRGGHKDVVTLLLRHGAQASHTNIIGETPLLDASWQGHLGVVQMLIEATEGQGLVERDTQGWTALFYAVQGGHKDVVTLLLKHGAAPHIRDRKGQTPLMKASWGDQLGLVQVLLEATGGKGLDERDKDGRTALSLAAVRERHSYEPEGCPEVLKALLLAGANPSIADNQGNTPRQLAEMKGFTHCVETFEWWDGELERPYVLYRTRSIHDVSIRFQAAPVPPFPAYLAARVPTVEIVKREHEDEPGASEKKLKTAADIREEEEEARDAVLRFVVNDLNEQLFPELMEYFHGFRSQART